MESSAGFPIDPKQLGAHTDRANRLLAGVQWTPTRDKLGKQASVYPLKWRESGSEKSSAEEVSLIQIARRVSGDPLLLSEETNHVLTVLRMALQIAMHVSREYTKSSGLEHLIEQNKRGALTEAQKTEFRAKYHSASAVTVFVVAYYVTWELSDYKSEEVADIAMDFAGLPELALPNPVQALECLLYYYGAYVDKSGVVKSNLDFLKLTLLYFRAVIDEVKLREDSLQHTRHFVDNSYRLLGSEFWVRGFEVELGADQISIEFNRVELGQIVGNHDAKHKARRLAERLMCYDPAAQRNPMHDLGGLPTLRMGYGEPGTGKSMQIAATATLLFDYCKELGLPFLFWPLPDNVISTFQGGSSERMLKWLRPFRDTSRIVYGPIDDAENVLENRTRQGVSAGVREVVATFLRHTEGAYAVHHGNAVVELFTNLPDQLDPAVLSRIMDRFYIGGAENREDFLDQDHLWWQRYREIDAGFVDMRDPEGYEYLSNQVLVSTLALAYGEEDIPKAARVKAVFEHVQAEHEPSQQTFFAALFTRTKEIFPMFTSRDVRNIQRAVDERVLDFDLPPAWLENPETFYRQDYPTKRSMIVEQMQANMQGLSFHELRCQEAGRYLDNFVRIAATARERRIDEMVEQAELQREAGARVQAGRERT